MTVLVTADFSAAASTWFNGATAQTSVAGGVLTFTGEGSILGKTTVGTGVKWAKVQITAIPNDAANPKFGISLGDASGNLWLWALSWDGTNLIVGYVGDYSTYTTWNADDVSVYLQSAYTIGNYVGVTFDPSDHTFRIWRNVTAAEPASASLWDGNAPDQSNTNITFKANSNYIGLGSTSSTPTGRSFDNFTAGDIGGAAATHGALMMMGAGD